MNFKFGMLKKPLVVTAAVTFFVSSAQAQKSPRRVSFARGATVAHATGYLRGIRDAAWFVLRAGAGQHMRVEISAYGATHGTIVFPSGKQETQPGSVVFDDNIDETGDYKIGVSESTMGNAWRGKFTLTVKILPRAQSSPDTAGLEKYVGKYPSELFRNVPALKPRLRALLGSRYQFFFDRLQTEMPIVNDAGVLIVQGCMAHQCTIEVAVLAIDVASDKLHVAIKSNEFRNMYKIWSEGGAQVPAALRRAMQEASPS